MRVRSCWPIFCRRGRPEWSEARETKSIVVAFSCVRHGRKMSRVVARCVGVERKERHNVCVCVCLCECVSGCRVHVGKFGTFLTALSFISLCVL